MELSKNIFFNTDKLTSNSTVKISYTGKFFTDNSEKVYIHYGFGLLWDGVSEIEMVKTDLGFQAEIELIDSDSFNFCFKNELDVWDNNDGNNYIFPIEKVETCLTVTEEAPSSLAPARKLRKSYLWSKKIKLALYKIIISVPRLISGNYRRKVSEE